MIARFFMALSKASMLEAAMWRRLQCYTLQRAALRAALYQLRMANGELP